MTQKEINRLMLEKIIGILKYDNINPMEVWFPEFDCEDEEYNPAWESDRKKFEKAKKWIGGMLEQSLRRLSS